PFGDQARIKAQRYDGGGLPLGGEFQVNTVSADSQIKPKGAMNGTGSFVVVWEDYSGQDGSAGLDGGSGLEGQRYDGTGAPMGGEFQINTETLGSQYDGEVAMDQTGAFVVVWTDNTGLDGSGTSIQGRRYDGNGVAIGGEFQVNTATTGYQELPAV